MTRLRYLFDSVTRSRDPARHCCPNCGEPRSILIERKFLVTALRRCGSCQLMYRTPTDGVAESSRFYNNNYREGFTTESPPLAALDAMIENGFSGQQNNYPYYISVLRALSNHKEHALFDFGCSWGYGSYQFSKGGFDVLSYEISKPRAVYAERHLDVKIVPSFAQWVDENPQTVDIFFSAHVLEHVPSPSDIINTARKLIRPGGLFVGFFPNGSAAFRAREPAWSKLWGKVHPNFLDDVYLNRAVSDRPRIFGCSPVEITDDIAGWLRDSERPAAYYLDPLDRMEMFFAFRV